MQHTMYYKYIIIAVLFLMGAYFVLNYSSADFKEALTMPKNSNKNSDCPNILVQKGSKIYLYNSKKFMVPGVNPITFNNLEEYVQVLCKDEIILNQNNRTPIGFSHKTN